jgi:predicted double-glycine peptidase
MEQGMDYKFTKQAVIKGFSIERLFTWGALFISFMVVNPSGILANNQESVVSLKEIREAGVVKQKWDTSCGAAAMATVFTHYFNDPVSEREVAEGLLRQTEPLKVRYQGGFSMLDMKRYAQERGYKAIGFKQLSFEDLRYFDGSIIPVNLNGYNHYVVYKGLTLDDKVWLADPAYGNRTISRKRFERVWLDGILFTLIKGNK